MRYIEGTLSKDEKIMIVPELHWFNYIAYFIIFLFWFMNLAMITFLCLAFQMNPNEIALYIYTFIISFIPTFIYLIVLIIGYRFIELACTNKRVVYKKGIVMRNANELQLGKIESVEVKQSVMGRILGYGDIHFSGTGTSKVEFQRIKNALQIKGQIADILEEYKN